MTQLVIEICYSSELLQRARLFVTLIYGVTIQKKPLWDRHWLSLIVIESSELLQRARFIVTLICGGPYAVTIQKKPLWDCHWSSLVVIDRHWVLWTPTAGEIIYHFNLWRNHSKETSLRLSLIVIGRHWSSLIVIESSELLQWEKFIVTWICVGPYGVTIQKKPLWLNVCIVQSNRV